MDKVLTISIAAYNVEKYIEKTIRSCLNERTADDVELLIIDDGGQDRTVEIAETLRAQFPDSIRIVRKENGGYGSTINQGVKLARGRYFKQLDGDDWFDISGLEVHLQELKAHDVDMALTPNVKYFEGSGQQQIRDNAANLQSGEYAIEYADILGNINMHSVTYRTQMLKDMNLSITEHCFYTDTEYVLFPLPYVKRIYVSHTPVYFYRVGASEQSTSYQGMRKHFNDHTTVFWHIVSLYEGIEDKEQKYAQWIYYRLKEETINHYRYYCMKDMNRANLRELKAFDASLKKYPRLYQETKSSSKFVRILRDSKFLLYPLCCKKAKTDKS